MQQQLQQTTLINTVFLAQSLEVQNINISYPYLPLYTGSLSKVELTSKYSILTDKPLNGLDLNYLKE